MKFSLSDYLYPFEILRLYRSLRASAHFPIERLVELQDRKLCTIVEHAYAHVPYYREVFNNTGLTPHDIRTVDDLSKIPILTKDIVRERYEDLIADNSDRFHPYVNRTSGSTGTPLRFLQDKQTSIARFAFFWRVWEVAGYRPFIKWAQVDGMFTPQQAGELWRHHRVLNSLQVSAYELNEVNCERVWDAMNAFRPRVVRGYPSALDTLAEHGLKRNKRLRRRLKGIICYSETLQDDQRTRIQEAFSADVYDVYAMWEAVCIIAECEHHTKHQQMEYSAMELLDNENQPVAPGMTGEITATSFHSFAMPFIRYKTGDLASASLVKCPCGQEHMAVAQIDGRIDDMLITPEGARVGRLSTVFRNVTGYNYAQIIQNATDEIDVLLVKNDSYRAGDLNVLEKELRRKVGYTMRIHFQFVDDIRPSANGKRRLVVNKMAKKAL